MPNSTRDRHLKSQLHRTKLSPFWCGNLSYSCALRDKAAWAGSCLFSINGETWDTWSSWRGAWAQGCLTDFMERSPVQKLTVTQPVSLFLNFKVRCQNHNSPPLYGRSWRKLTSPTPIIYCFSKIPWKFCIFWSLSCVLHVQPISTPLIPSPTASVVSLCDEA